MSDWVGVAAAVLIVLAAVSIPLLFYANADYLVDRFKKK
ncbi:Uncharacterised protein [Zhongshania aliphaticivorans]|uniref:Uncharacterized protein n=1 Tax=Zhongshania aliphaticivorans TaxID=1470434 RepID=A0A5S9NSG4_9GAMM|nr:Uncharacterised protein [Zhongshania aliphaticivorans]CAA0111407.1 Uncharacterised protein [Zhongshania aliphaticivorans]